MARQYHLIVGMSLVILVTGHTPFIMNATIDQQMAASDIDRISNITQVLADRTDPILLNEEGLESYLTSPILELTTSQEQELAEHFGPLLMPFVLEDSTDLLCPTTQDGQLVLYLDQDGYLLQVITEITFGGCQHRNPPGSCLDSTADAALRCYCCVRYRTAVALVVEVSSCSTGSCQLTIYEVMVPYCTCCQYTCQCTCCQDTTTPIPPTTHTTPTTEILTTPP